MSRNGQLAREELCSEKAAEKDYLKDFPCIKCHVMVYCM